MEKATGLGDMVVRRKRDTTKLQVPASSPFALWKGLMSEDGG